MGWRSRITVLEVDTRRAEVVLEADDLLEAPNWARDGGHLLVNGGGSLFRLPLDGGRRGLERIGLDRRYACNNDHDYSPDGSLLAFSASSPDSPDSRVYVARADGSAPRLLTPQAPSYFHGWSPDGAWLAFAGTRNGGGFDLFRVRAEGGEEERLTAAPGDDDGPDYAPDGRWIYFNSNRTRRWNLWRMPAGGGDAEQVTFDEPEDWFPHVSPDGRRIAFVSFPPGTEGHDGRGPGFAIRLIDAPGERIEPATPVTLAEIFGGQGTMNVNSWSPDSTRIAYVEYEPADGGEA